MNGRAVGATIFPLLATALCFGQSADLSAQSQVAKQAMAAGQFERAAGMYAQLVRELPRNAGMLLNFGMALHYEGHYAEAVQQLKAALLIEPGLIAADFFLGVSYAKLHEPALAIAPLLTAATAEPANKLFQLELADALLATEQYEKAAVHFQRVTDLDSADAKAWQGMGMSFVGLSQLCFRTLQLRAPTSPYVLLLLANSDLKQGRYRNAYARYRAALARGVSALGVYTELAEVYRKTQHPDWAATEEQRERELPAPNCDVNSEACAYLSGDYRKAVVSSSMAPQALYWKARSYEALALAAFDKLNQMPPTPEIHELMAEAYQIRGQNHESSQEFLEALKLDPGNTRLKALYATALWRDHNYGSAEPLLKQLLRTDQNSAELTFELGDTLLELDDLKNALPLLAQAVKRDPRMLAAQASLGRADMEAGQIAAAIPHLQAALAADIDGSLYFQLAKAYEETGQAALAKHAREQFVLITKRRNAVQSDGAAEISAP